MSSGRSATWDDGGIPSDADMATDAGEVASDAGSVDGGTEPPPPPPPPTTDCPTVRVTTVGLPLNVRSIPSVSGDIVGTLAEGAVVMVIEETTGDSVEGVTTWYEIDS